VSIAILDALAGDRAPAPVALGRGEMHVWRVELGPSEGTSAEPRERVRARKHESQEALRAVLAGYLRCAPADVRVEPAQFGKPALAAPRSDLQFNLSRSGDRCVIAVGRSAPVGIDLERVWPIADVERMSERFLAPAEALAIGNERGDARVRAFFNCWTRKEAYAKAVGVGLALPFHRFCVSVAETPEPAILSLAGDDPGAWTLRSLEPWPGYVAAVATRQRLPAAVSVRTLAGPG
jgi:4'-phosphopantetheinyl transferase